MVLVRFFAEIPVRGDFFIHGIAGDRMQKTFAEPFEDPDGKVSPCGEIVAETGRNEILPCCIKPGTGIRTHRRLAENDRLAVLPQHAGLSFPRQTRIGVEDFCRNQTVPPGNISAAEVESELDHLVEPFDQCPIRNGFDRRIGQMPYAELGMIVIDFHFSPLGLFCTYYNPQGLTFFVIRV